MEYFPVIIVGGGPAGSVCAWKLRLLGIECLVLDKQAFPRDKLCAGWITPWVFEDIDCIPDEYPHGLLTFKNIHAHIHGLRIRLPGPHYSIRRREFDSWLLDRSHAEFRIHHIRSIHKDDRRYILDDRYFCDYLVGSGGTTCPVQRSFFSGNHPRRTESLIVTLECEFPYKYGDDRCLLWFFENRLPGYSWYVPKAGGHLNIGIGGLSRTMKQRGLSIKELWNLFTKKLYRLRLLEEKEIIPKGYTYYRNDSTRVLRNRNAFIAGDAAGLATRDLGEGIGPAIRSGILVAESIAHDSEPDPRRIHRYSPVWPFSRCRRRRLR